MRTFGIYDVHLMAIANAPVCPLYWQDHGASDSSVLRRMPFRIMQLLDGQMENLLEVECGISQYSDPLDVPIERIRVRF